MNGLDALLDPRTIAVVGASRDPTKIGHLVVKHLLDSEASLYPVNPSADEVLGLRCYPDLDSIPAPIDLAVLAVPAPVTVAMVRACVRRGVRAIIAQASGFGETGSEGKRLEQEVKDILATAPREHRPRLLGPNTLGVFVPKRKLDTTFTVRERSPRPGPGDIAFISQSGATGVCIMEAAAYMGLGFSAFVGIGNKLDVQENELLEYFAADNDTRAIAVYLEGFRDGRAFLETCRRVTPHKPVVVVKAGRSAAGMKAAALHTGTLAGSDRVVEGALRQAGAFRAYDEEELIDLVRALGHGRPFAGKRVGVVTTAGGFGVILADLLASVRQGVGLELAGISRAGQERLRSLLVPFASVHNPVDLTANATNEHYDATLELLEAEDGVDAILCVMQFQSPNVDEHLAESIVRWFHEGPKPMVVASIGGELSQHWLRRLAQAGVPAYPSLWRAARALAALHQRAHHLARIGTGNAPEAAGTGAVAATALDPAELIRLGQPLAEHQVKQLLRRYGITVPPHLVLPASSGTTRTTHERCPSLPFPYPVVVKVSDPGILHKTELGGVRLGIHDEAELQRVLEEMRERFPGKTLLVEAQESPGVEVIVGLIHDATFGPSLMFGLGGIFTELYEDVAFRVAPITPADAIDMIYQVRAHRLFTGFRGIQASQDAVISVLLAMSRLAEELGGYIEQMDLNPVIVKANHAVVVDAKLRLLPCQNGHTENDGTQNDRAQNGRTPDDGGQNL